MLQKLLVDFYGVIPLGEWCIKPIKHRFVDMFQRAVQHQLHIGRHIIQVGLRPAVP